MLVLCQTEGLDEYREHERCLARLNEKLNRKMRNILLLMDNGPCHLPSIANSFSNVSIKFLPKNTTSKTQPLDAGIIGNWKVKCKKKLLRYVCSKVDGVKNASEIVKSINLSMAIEWVSRPGVRCRRIRLSSVLRKQGCTHRR